MLNPTSIWPQPHAEDQFSHIIPQDSDGCISYSTVHAIESYIKYTLGIQVDFSERFLAKMSGTTLNGNSLENVVNALKTYGLVLDSDWPEPTTFTWAEYYAEIPQEIIAKGKDVLAQYINIGDVIQIAQENITEALQNTPLIIFTPSGTPTHARCVLSPTEIFDSYPPYIEGMPESIYGFYQIELTPNKEMNQAKVVKSKTSPTIYVCYPMPSEDYLKTKGELEGFSIPADLSQVPDSDSLT